MIRAMRIAAQKQVNITPEKFNSDALALNFSSGRYALFLQSQGHIEGLCIHYIFIYYFLCFQQRKEQVY